MKRLGRITAAQKANLNDLDLYKTKIKDLKNKKKIKEVTIIASIKNFPSSALMVCEYFVLTYGIPEILTSRLYFSSNSLTFGSNIFVINFSLSSVVLDMRNRECVRLLFLDWHFSKQGF